MEKFSRFRDAGTGIQVFLQPVPPAGKVSPLAVLLTPINYLAGVVRFILLLAISLIWTVFLLAFGSIPVPLSSAIHAIFGRLALFLLGFAWISPELVSLRNRGRAAATSSRRNSFTPSKGDIIICNWSSYVDVLWLLLQFNPGFVLPVVADRPIAASTAPATTAAAARSPARRKNAAIHSYSPQQAAAGTPAEPREVLGFKKASLLEMLARTGKTPYTAQEVPRNAYAPLDTLLAKAHGPVVVFPEFVTSNNRGLLRTGSVFPPSWISTYRTTGALRLGSAGPHIFVCSIRHDAPSASAPSSTVSVPSGAMNPLPHLWSLCANLSFARTLTIRLLDPADSPTSTTFVSDVGAANSNSDDPLSDTCGNLIAQLSRLRKTNLGWADKETFLDLYRSRR